MRKKESVLILVVLFVLMGTISSFGQRDFLMEERKLVEKFKFADKHFAKGKEYFIKGNTAKAEKELGKCLEIMPEHADALYFLSQIDYKKGNFDQALEKIEKAKANFDFIAKFYTFTHQTRLESLREEKQKLEMNLMDLQNRLPSITNQDERQRVESAIANTRNDISIIENRLREPIPPVLDTPADYFYIHGNTLFKLKRYQDAHDQYVEAIKRDPKHGNAYNNLINLYFIAKDYQEALAYLKKAEANGAQINPELKKAVEKAAKNRKFTPCMT
jgi:pentatricopeptide repeat protein